MTVLPWGRIRFRFALFGKQADNHKNYKDAYCGGGGQRYWDAETRGEH